MPDKAPAAKRRRLGQARELRAAATSAERRLWTILRGRGVVTAKFRRQQPFGPYVLDFYCHEQRLVIEVDGGQHSSEIGQKRDSERTQYLQARGIRVLRFTNLEVLTEPAGVFDKIREAVEQGTSP